MSSDRYPARSFRDLMVWQRAHEFVLAVYRYTESFPERERYGLAHQLRRAAVSIPANIAEGFGKRSKADKARFLNIALSGHPKTGHLWTGQNRPLDSDSGR
jgi:hypothetical protein